MQKNSFLNHNVAVEYDNYYKKNSGQKVDLIEKEIISGFLTKINHGTMLELGCGTGHWTTFFCSLGFNVTAVDQSDEMLNFATTKKIPNATFINANAENLPFANNSFSIITSITMLEFVNNTQKIIDEIYRLLAPGGHLILGCLNQKSALGLVKNNDPVFKPATFFTKNEIEILLSEFCNTTIISGVYYSANFDILDNTPQQNTVEPAFMGVYAQKKQ